MATKQKILIVDDDTNIAELISLYLTKECYETKMVHDGESALRELSLFQPNLILLDLMLPGMDGYQVCREVRTKSQVPIIMLSAKGEVFDKVLEARTALVNANTVEDKAEADAQLDTALQGINVIVENYPELKSDATYIALMDELEGSENRIAVARKDYNDAVKDYNNKVIRFPGSIAASIFGFEKAEYFEADEESQTVPDVGAALGE